ncbi:hypothetical protein EVAR_102712_1 [Eumeta japonica]|uniref:Uncharacterized protein n=1 Tax=Eumeta variegata TaxID=151549 RepID=A0A4C1TIL2_EUMVA|nr:hypothetical protein EVAR_102712_1 [Eumeta japonica]
MDAAPANGARHVARPNGPPTEHPVSHPYAVADLQLCPSRFGTFGSRNRSVNKQRYKKLRARTAGRRGGRGGGVQKKKTKVSHAQLERFRCGQHDNGRTSRAGGRGLTFRETRPPAAVGQTDLPPAPDARETLVGDGNVPKRNTDYERRGYTVSESYGWATPPSTHPPLHQISYSYPKDRQRTGAFSEALETDPNNETKVFINANSSKALNAARPLPATTATPIRRDNGDGLKHVYDENTWEGQRRERN